MSLRLVEPAASDDPRSPTDDPLSPPLDPPLDPRDPALFRPGLSSARAALRDGRARQHARAANGAEGSDDADARDREGRDA